MSQSPKKFEDFKNEMEDHWKEEIIKPNELKRKSASFYMKYILDYSINCLFIELLDLQIHLSEECKDFQKPFIYPIHEEINCVNKKIHEIDKTELSELIASVDKDNLTNFLNENTNFIYYFWNVTFPNIFLGFISEEYCKSAALFLKSFQNDKENFSTGVSSFITHNYYFQDSFMKSYFINSQNLNFEESIQNSLEKAVQKLTIQQLDTLEILIDNYPEKAMEMFLDKIIIRSIKLYKYSPLFSSSQINGDGEEKLLNYIDTHFKNDANHEENLKNLLNPVFAAVKSKITMNEIKICRIIFNADHKFALTFLDILILQKISKTQCYAAQAGPLFDKHDASYLLKKAFYYIIFNNNESQPADIKNAVKISDKIKLDQFYVDKWNKYKEDKEKHNQNPLEVFYIEEKLNELLKKDSQLALTGIASSYYEWLEYNKTKAMLKKESRVLILLKTILEGQKNYIETISTYYSFTFPIGNNNFVQNLKGLFKDIMKNVILKHVKKRYITYNEYNNQIKSDYELIKEAKKKKETKKIKNTITKLNNDIERCKSSRKAEYDKIVTEFNEKITKELSQNFDHYFNNKAGAENLYTFTVGEVNYLYKNHKIILPVSLIKYSFDKYIEFIQYLTRAYLISYYNKLNVAKSKIKIEEIKIDQIKKDLFLPYASSGVFNYINDFVESLESIENDSKIPIGQIFATVPVINKFLKQFVASQNTESFILKQADFIYDKEELAKSIFCYAFIFYTINMEDDTNESSINAFKKLTDFVEYIFTALNELRTFKDTFPYFQELNNEFEFLIQYLPIVKDK